MSQPPLDIAQLYERYAPMVRRRVAHFFSPPRHEEIVQEVFVRALQHQETFRHQSSPGTWLWSIATNLCVTELKKRQRRQELMDAYTLENPAPSAQERVHEARAILRQISETMPDELLQVCIHYYVDGMTQQQIGELMDCSHRTVGNRLKESQAWLRRADDGSAKR